MASISIERLGGLAGLGSPGARMVSRGRVELEALAPHEREAVEALFARTNAPVADAKASLARDAFRYRITRHGGKGEEAVEVAEAHVPAGLLGSIVDELT